MLITLEKLQEKNASQDLIDYFSQYPNGIKIKDVYTDKKTPSRILHWCIAHLPYTKELERLYYAACQVVNSKSVFHSTNVLDSFSVSYSEDICDSKGIFNCTDVNLSCNVLDSDNVKNSCWVWYSNNIYDSQKIHSSRTISNSSNVTFSTFVTNSRNVFNSKTILNSNAIRNSENLENCFMCAKCSNLSNAAFCEDLHDKDKSKYYVFNKEVTESMFKFLVSGFNDIFKDNFLLIEFKEKVLLDLDGVFVTHTPAVTVQAFDKIYEKISDKFWNWVKTLPNYNSEILYHITFVPKLWT